MNRLIKWSLFFTGGGIIMALLLVGFIWFSGGSSPVSANLATPELARRADDNRSLFVIDTTQSEARFIIHEVLLGDPTTVIGRTESLAGEMLVDFASPANSQLGAILINLATISTDNELRNRALRGQILQSNQEEFELATFIPTAIIGLPDSVSIGETITFEIEGVLNVHGVNREVTFEASVTPVTDTRLEGFASTTVRYGDFDLTIPEVAGVANVSHEVVLEIEFVATATD